MEFIGWMLVILAVACLALSAWRFVTLRSRATTVLLRRFPAKSLNSWRHGAIQYNTELVYFYKLRSIAPRADLVIDRKNVVVEAHRTPTAQEFEIMPRGTRITQILVGDRSYEIASDRRGIMALISWLEAAPDVRQEKVDHRALAQRVGRARQQG
ncbi:DUF2550 domain-containing protein [Corynebacterium cystitidis]|uniref:DUF2550 domain-containing protein n=1 Tax=Corynebacterium cystitidis TaxID=35757 RepID=UPI00211E7553|nr:DUF2550 domain-containing protein [Corynebacterium cystitidis]